MLEQGGGGCWICGKPPKEGRRLHVDHDHTFHKAKIVISKADNLFTITAFLFGKPIIPTYMFTGTKKEAKEHCKTKLKRMSVRGLLCWQHNAAIAKFRDNIDHLLSAANYLKSYKEGLNVPIS
jgi:hypothetical protein